MPKQQGYIKLADIAKPLNIQERLQLKNSYVGGIMMRKFILWIAALLLCAAVVYGDSGINIGNAFQFEGAVRVGIENNNKHDIDNARVRIYIPELGIRSPSITVDLDDDDHSVARLYPVDDVPEGEYLVRISIRKDGRRKIAYRYVYFE